MTAKTLVPRLALDIRCRNFRGKLIVARGDVALELDEVGATIFKWIDGTSTIDDLANQVVSEYGIPYEQALEDCDEFISELVASGVVRTD